MIGATKLKAAAVGIGVVGALALSSGGAAYASAVRPDSNNGCGESITAGNPVHGYAVAINTTCGFSFQLLTPSGTNIVVESGTLPAGYGYDDTWYVPSGDLARVCTHGFGVTECTPWVS